MIRGCIRGDSRMQKAFYYQFFPIVMRICIRYAPNRQDAEQWVHDGFLKVFQNLDKYEAKGSFEGWMSRVVSRVCLDNIRQANKLVFEPEKNTITTDRFDFAEHISVDNEALSRYSADEVLRLLNHLPEKQKLVLNLFVYEDYSHKEIAQMTGITENYSCWLLHQAKKTLISIIHKTHQKKVYHEQ